MCGYIKQPKDTNAICFYFLSNLVANVKRLISCYDNANMKQPLYSSNLIWQPKSSSSILHDNFKNTLTFYFCTAHRYVARMHVLQGVYRKWQYWSPISLRAVLHWRVQSKLALTGRRIDDFSELWWLVVSGGSYIWVSSTSFKKKWQQPPIKKLLKFDMIFPDSTKKVFFTISKSSWIQEPEWH